MWLRVLQQKFDLTWWECARIWTPVFGCPHPKELWAHLQHETKGGSHQESEFSLWKSVCNVMCVVISSFARIQLLWETQQPWPHLFDVVDLATPVGLVDPRPVRVLDLFSVGACSRLLEINFTVWFTWHRNAIQIDRTTQDRTELEACLTPKTLRRSGQGQCKCAEKDTALWSWMSAKMTVTRDIRLNWCSCNLRAGPHSCSHKSWSLSKRTVIFSTSIWNWYFHWDTWGSAQPVSGRQELDLNFFIRLPHSLHRGGSSLRAGWGWLQPGGRAGRLLPGSRVGVLAQAVVLGESTGVMLQKHVFTGGSQVQQNEETPAWKWPDPDPRNITWSLVEYLVISAWIWNGHTPVSSGVGVCPFTGPAPGSHPQRSAASLSHVFPFLTH